MPRSAIDRLLAMPVITDAALGKALAAVQKDGKLSPKELTELQKLQSLPDDRFEHPPDNDVWRGQTEELESLLGARDLVNAGLTVSKLPAGISVSMKPDTTIADEDAGGGFVRVYSRELVVKIGDAVQPKDATLDFTYAGYKIRVPIRKGESRDSVFSKIESRLLRQQQAYEMRDGRNSKTYSISSVRTYGHEGTRQAARRVAVEDERWVRAVMGEVVDAAAYRSKTPGERAGTLAAEVTTLLKSSAMSAEDLTQLRARAERGGLTQHELDQLVRVAVQPRARVAGAEGGAPFEAMAALRSLVEYGKPLLAPSFEVRKTLPGVSVAMGENLTLETMPDDEAGPTKAFARKLTVSLTEATLRQGGTVQLRFGTRDVEIRLERGMTRAAAKEKIADALMTIATSCRWGGIDGVVALVTHA